ncbi:MAG TPA: flavodoxin-dependent (E)-4-hydroxy-3-methylbut-2-enyl-diphosphate synthase [Candidatus Methanoperedens sp.]|nr:flavodoxin-dependent (E)-4-hydroxy-3-methylbut-2-enyl-diphosphate synthase [Candidatus Methanoperedens sp.]
MAGGNARRRRTVAVRVGAVTIGGGAPVSVQSMTKTDTRDVGATVRQLRALARAGCRIGRVAVPDRGALDAFARIRARTTLPLVADIHFDYRLAIACIDAGADKVRINPGNIGGTGRLQEVGRRARERGCAIRVGVNAGSLEKELFARHGGATPAALVESAAHAIRDLEAVGCTAIVVSLKASSVPHTIAAYRLAARALRYPLHLGVTEAGFGLAGIVKSASSVPRPTGSAIPCASPSPHRRSRRCGSAARSSPRSDCSAQGSRSSRARRAAAAGSTCGGRRARCAAASRISRSR